MNFTRQVMTATCWSCSHPGSGAYLFGPLGAQVRQTAELAACPCHRSGADRAPRGPITGPHDPTDGFLY
jgi:hypothetical protein